MNREKNESLRASKRQLRRSLGTVQQRRNAIAAARAVKNPPRYLQAAKHIGIYLDFDGELPTAPLIKALKRKGAQLYVPVIDNSNQSMRFVSLTAYKRGENLNSFGIREPSRRSASACILDVVFVPLTAFDSAGNRLGMGGGFYDRHFARIQTQSRRTSRLAGTVLVGMGHACQQVKTGRINIQHWDLAMQFMLTERGLRKCVNRRSEGYS